MRIPVIIEQIKKTAGVYLLSSPESPELAVPVFVDTNGRIYAFRFDQALTDDGWLDTIQASGPLTLNSPKIEIDFNGG